MPCENELNSCEAEKETKGYGMKNKPYILLLCGLVLLAGCRQHQYPRSLQLADSLCSVRPEQRLVAA